MLLGEKAYRSHELTYAGELITCGHCGNPVTGEAVTKKTTGKTYVYYRCSKYNRLGHARVRVTEAELERQVLNLFDRMRLPDATREWFGRMLVKWNQNAQQQSRDTAEGHQKELSSLREQQDRLLNLHFLGEIEAETYSKKNAELRDRIAASTLQLEATHRTRDEHAELVQKVFELSQSMKQRLVTADYAAKRRLLEIACLNFRLDDVTLVPEMRKPFDVLVKGLLVQSNRGDWI